MARRNAHIQETIQPDLDPIVVPDQLESPAQCFDPESLQVTPKKPYPVLNSTSPFAAMGYQLYDIGAAGEDDFENSIAPMASLDMEYMNDPRHCGPQDGSDDILLLDGYGSMDWGYF